MGAARHAPQLLARAIEPGHYGADRHAEHLRDVLVAQLLDRREQKDLALLVRADARSARKARSARAGRIASRTPEFPTPPPAHRRHRERLPRIRAGATKTD